jgi:Trypsin-like peptidase domain
VTLSGTFAGPRIVALLVAISIAAAAIGLVLTRVPAQAAVAGAARVARSVVFLELPGPYPGAPPTLTGTGFIAASNASASYIVTAAHVMNCDTYGNGCRPSIGVRLAGGATAPAGLVYAGASSDVDDYAIVRIARGNLPFLELRDATAGEAIGVLGFPKLLDNRGNVPLLREGTVTDVQRDRRELALKLATEEGDSGGPIFDAQSDGVVGIVHGTLGGGTQDQRSAVAVATVRAALADATSNGSDDARMRAKLLYEYAIAAAGRCAYLTTVATGIEVDTMCAQADALLSDALAAGSSDAQIYVLQDPGHYGFFMGLRTREAVLAAVDAVAATGNAPAAYALAQHYRLEFINATAAGEKATAGTDVLRYFTLAADHGDPVAMTLLAIFYQQAAKGNAEQGGQIAFSAYDPAWDLGQPRDLAAAQSWAAKAQVPLAQRVDRGDAQAAYIAALQFQYTPIGQDFSNVGLVAARYVKAVALGSDAALSHLGDYSALSGSVQADIFHALKNAVDSGKTGDFAIALGQMYAQGNGTPVDQRQALLAYRAGGYNPLSAALPGLVPNSDLFGPTLAATPGYKVALATTVRMKVPGADQSSPDVVRGIIVRSGPGSVVIATGAYGLGCDLWAKGCIKPVEVDFPDGSKATAGIAVIRQVAPDLSDGVALVRVEHAAVPAATIGAPAGNVVAMACLSGEWGVVLSEPAEHNVLDLGVPFPFQPGVVGCGLFDLHTGRLVGMYTDPWHVYNAAGPDTMQHALADPAAH